MQVIRITQLGSLKCAHVTYAGSYYIVSQSRKMGLETTIFLSDREGNIIDYNEKGGAVATTLEEVLSDFKHYLIR